MKNIQQNINTKMRRGTSENSWSRSTSWHWRSAAGKKLKRDSSDVIKYQKRTIGRNKENDESEGLAASSWTGDALECQGCVGI
jgi:hypothetical protein